MVIGAMTFGAGLRELINDVLSQSVFVSVKVL